MNEKQVLRLVKILNLTTSENDFETLNAIRKANAMLKDSQLTWSDMYRPKRIHTGWEV